MVIRRSFFINNKGQCYAEVQILTCDNKKVRFIRSFFVICVVFCKKKYTFAHLCLERQVIGLLTF